MTKLNSVKALLSDNRGDENISKMIWVAIVFIVGAILLALIVYAFRKPISEWYARTIGSWFDNSKSSINNAYQGQVDPSVAPLFTAADAPAATVAP